MIHEPIYSHHHQHHPSFMLSQALIAFQCLKLVSRCLTWCLILLSHTAVSSSHRRGGPCCPDSRRHRSCLVSTRPPHSSLPCTCCHLLQSAHCPHPMIDHGVMAGIEGDHQQLAWFRRNPTIPCIHSTHMICTCFHI